MTATGRWPSRPTDLGVTHSGPDQFLDEFDRELSVERKADRRLFCYEISDLVLVLLKDRCRYTKKSDVSFGDAKIDSAAFLPIAGHPIADAFRSVRGDLFDRRPDLTEPEPQPFGGALDILVNVLRCLSHRYLTTVGTINILWTADGRFLKVA